jgi:hypothetical protein
VAIGALIGFVSTPGVLAPAIEGKQSEWKCPLLRCATEDQHFGDHSRSLAIEVAGHAWMGVLLRDLILSANKLRGVRDLNFCISHLPLADLQF